MAYNLEVETNGNNKTSMVAFDSDSKIFEDIKGHCKRVAKLSVLIGRELKINKSELEKLSQSALLHDYGKYYIPHNILLKPSKLTIGEMKIMKKHVYYGSKIAISKHKDEDVATNILYHHENYDGTGYYGVRGEFIPLGSRIIKVADIFDALTSNRPYRNALNICNALNIMENEKEHYEGKIYEIFIQKVVTKLSN